MEEQKIIEQLEMELEAHTYATETFEEEKKVVAAEINSLLQQFTIDEMNQGLHCISSKYRIVAFDGS